MLYLLFDTMNFLWYWYVCFYYFHCPSWQAFKSIIYMYMYQCKQTILSRDFIVFITACLLSFFSVPKLNCILLPCIVLVILRIHFTFLCYWVDHTAAHSRSQSSSHILPDHGHRLMIWWLWRCLQPQVNKDLWPFPLDLQAGCEFSLHQSAHRQSKWPYPFKNQENEISMKSIQSKWF